MDAASAEAAAKGVEIERLAFPAEAAGFETVS
jgi:hypothetical protein